MVARFTEELQLPSINIAFAQYRITAVVHTAVSLALITEHTAIQPTIAMLLPSAGGTGFPTVLGGIADFNGTVARATARITWGACVTLLPFAATEARGTELNLTPFSVLTFLQRVRKTLKVSFSAFSRGPHLVVTKHEETPGRTQQRGRGTQQRSPEKQSPKQ